jgi:hypothetical protein
VLKPHFDAVRDIFVEFGLVRLERVRFSIEPEIHDKARHFAATTETGIEQMYAPEIIELPHDTLVAILAHEFGHSSDFAYPGWWLGPVRGPGEEVIFLGDQPGSFWGSKRGRATVQSWERRSRDQVEWTADAIAELVTDKRIGYAGDCMLQTLRGGVERPAGLR